MNVCILVSHNSRIQCLLDNILKEQPNRPSEKIRFQNGCVIKLILDSTRIELSLLYAGKISEEDEKKKDKIYYTTLFANEALSNSNSKYKEFNNITSTGENYTKCLKNLKLEKTNPCIVYIVRHGIGEHNVAGFFKHIRADPSLISPIDLNKHDYIKVGGECIKRDIASKNYEIKHVFVSDLKRTIQTAKLLIDYLYLIDRIHFEVKKFVVIPCTHEVNNAGKNGTCDADSSYMQFGRENTTSCTVALINHNTSSVPNHCFDIEQPILDSVLPPTPLDWSLYLSFYGNQMRGSNSNRFHCRDTSAISLIMHYLSNLDKSASKLQGYLNPTRDSQVRAFASFSRTGGIKRRKRTRKYKFKI